MFSKIPSELPIGQSVDQGDSATKSTFLRQLPTETKKKCKITLV